MTRRTTGWLVSAVAMVLLCAAIVSAHEVTYKGTVISADAKKLKITVVNDKDKTTTVRTFDIDKDTKFLRGDKPVPLADVKIQKDEQISVIVNLDDDENYAEEVRLPVRK